METALITILKDISLALTLVAVVTWGVVFLKRSL